MNRLDEAVLIEINDFCQKKTAHKVKGMYGVRDQNGLRSIAASVDQNVFGIDIYPNVFSKAAYLWRSITNYHCFYNGNKRTAFLAAYVFLYTNGYQLTIDRPVFFATALKLAAGELTDEAIEKLLQKSIQPIESVEEQTSALAILENCYSKDEELSRLIEELSVT